MGSFGETIRLRGEGMDPIRLRRIRKGLRTLHTLEVMAVQIYRFQAKTSHRELRPPLISAMRTEMEHVSDFLVSLLEYGFSPTWYRWAYWLVGWFFGCGSRLLGRRWILKTGIWVETKAVHHYDELLKGIDWEEAIRKVVEKDREDEIHHIQMWEGLLASQGGEV